MIRVNQKEIDTDTIANEMQYHPAVSQRESMIKASESLIISELVKQKAEALGLDLDAEKNEEQFLQALLDIEVDFPKATDEDCIHYFEQNPETFTTSPLLSVRHILLMAKPDDDKARIDANDKAQEMVKHLQEKPEDFAHLARQYSACDSSGSGGHLGQISKGQTVEEFERQVFPCDTGLIETPVATRYGYHIVMVDEKEDGKPLEYAMVEERIREYLNEKVRRKSIAQYIQTLINDAEIEGFDFSVSDSPLLQ